MKNFRWKKVLPALMTFVLFMQAVPCSVYAEETEQPAGETGAGSLEGNAYAVFSDNTLTFVRSFNTYTNNEEGTLVDINGNEYTGTIYADFESKENWYVNSPWKENAPDIERINVAEGQLIKPVSMDYWFEDSVRLVSVDLRGFDTSSTIRMNRVFSGCTNLKEINLSSLDTSSVTDMAGLFDHCESLEEITAGDFDTRNVTSMSCFFRGCSSLKDPDLTFLETGSVTNMSQMFSNCDSLTKIDLSSFDTSSATDMSGLFSFCDNLEETDLSGFDTGSVTNMRQMFWMCKTLKKLDLSHFDTSQVTDMQYMFCNCNNLTELDISHFNTARTEHMESMFSGCTNLEYVDVSSFDTSRVWSMMSMFSECRNLKELDVSGFDTSSSTSFQFMFSNCENLEIIDVSGFNTRASTTTSDMFAGCKKVKSLDLSNFDTTRSLFNVYRMFADCENLREIKLGEKFKDTDSSAYYPYGYWVNEEIGVRLKSDKFGREYTNHAAEYAGLWKIEPAAFAVLKDTGELIFTRSYEKYKADNRIEETLVDSKGNEITGLVYNLGSDDTALHGNWSFAKTPVRYVSVIEGQTFRPENMEAVFSLCYDLKSADLHGISAENTTSMRMMFRICRNLESLDLSMFSTGKLTNMERMFEECSSLQELDISGFNTENVITMYKLFSGCDSLRSIKLGPGFVKWISNAYLPEGNWKHDETGMVLTEKELYEQYPLNAETYQGTWRKTGKKAEGVQISKKTLNLMIGETGKLSAEVIPADSGNKKVEWKSDKPQIAEVDGEGNVKALSPGTAVITVTTADGGFTDQCTVTVEKKHGLIRLFGKLRYDTSIAIADELKKQLGTEKFEAVVVANGMKFADALAGGYLAAKNNAPILIINPDPAKPDSMNKMKEYIRSNLVSGGTVYLLGGPGAVPDTMKEELEGYEIRRLGGDNRYETNLLILQEAGVTDDDILIATGGSFADSLSASAAKRPILLVGKNGLNDEQREFLNAHKGNKFYILGGTAVVSADVENEVMGYGTTKRLGGEGRYETSVLIAEEFCKDADTAVLAYSGSFPDGLCGGPLAAVLNAPLLLTKTGKEDAAFGFCKKKDIHLGYVLGGTSLISDQAAKKILQLK